MSDQPTFGFHHDALTVEPVTFHDTVIEAGRDRDGTVRVDFIDLFAQFFADSSDTHRFYRRLCRHPAPSSGDMATMKLFSPIRQRAYRRRTIALRMLAFALALINPHKVKPAARDRLILFQREAADVLYAHFFGSPRGRAVMAETIPPAILTDALLESDPPDPEPMPPEVDTLRRDPLDVLFDEPYAELIPMVRESIHWIYDLRDSAETLEIARGRLTELLSVLPRIKTSMTPTRLTPKHPHPNPSHPKCTCQKPLPLPRRHTTPPAGVDCPLHNPSMGLFRQEELRLYDRPEHAHLAGEHATPDPQCSLCRASDAA